MASSNAFFLYNAEQSQRQPDVIQNERGAIVELGSAFEEFRRQGNNDTFVGGRAGGVLQMLDARVERTPNFVKHSQYQLIGQFAEHYTVKFTSTWVAAYTGCTPSCVAPIDFVAFAKACGVSAYRCTQPDEVEPTLRQAFSNPGISLVEAVVDPKEWPVKPEDV